jgi:hypothetical protein
MLVDGGISTGATRATVGELHLRVGHTKT